MFQLNHQGDTRRFSQLQPTSSWRRAGDVAAGSFRAVHARRTISAALVAMTAALMVMLLSAWFSPVWAGVSPCGTINASVTAGQQVQIGFNLGGCSSFGWNGILAYPTNGIIVAANPSEGDINTYIIYSNSGNGQLTDTFTAKDDSNNVMTFNITIAAPTSPLTISPTASANPTVAQNFSQQMTTSGGTAPYTYALVAGSLPNAVTMNAAGTFSGMPITRGTYNFTVQVTDASAPRNILTKQYQMTVGAATLTTTPASLTNGMVNTSYSQQLSTSGGIAPYSYVVDNGSSLPTGLSLSSTGLISGTPASAGTKSFTIIVTDSTGSMATINQAAYSMIVDPPPPPPVAGAVSQNVPYNSSLNPITLALSGGTATSVAVSGAPAHGTTSVSGTAIKYTPTAGYNGPDAFTYTATNAGGTSAPATVSLTVTAPVIIVSPSGTALNALGEARYSQTFSASGGTGPYTFAQTGTLPVGLSFNSATSTLSGTPLQGGTYTVKITATDSSTGTAVPGSRDYTLTVTNPVIRVSIPAATLQRGMPASLQASASGGVSPYMYAVTSGSLPTGLVLAADGSITGTPTVAGAYFFGITAVDSNGFTGVQNFASNVGAGAPVANPVATTIAYSTGAGSTTIAASLSGGTATSLTVGSGPSHGTVSVLSAASFSYTPTAGYSGTDSFSYTATNAVGTSSPATITVTISAPALVITPSTTWSALQGTNYSQTLTWSGGTAPYTAITVTGLPAGLSYTTSTTGATISGTPTQNGSFSVTASATDSSMPAPFIKSQTFTLTVGQAIPVAIADSANTNANQPVTVPVTSNDSGAISSIAVVAAPVHGTAVVSGLSVLYTPATNYFGSDSFTYTATGPGGTSAPATVSITVAALAVPTSAPQSASVAPGQSVTLHVGAAAANGPVTAVTVLSAPASGSVAVNGTDIVYTAVNGFSGNVQFTYAVSNVFGPSAAITATVRVGIVPVALNQSVSGAAGAAVAVDLMAGASGGPFTAATLGVLNPAAAGTVAIVNAGSGGSPSYRLNFTPAAAFSGVATVTYTLSNASGQSMAATVTITVGARTNATNDVQVKGIVAAHAQSASRFATAQLGNFSRRLESLHGSGWAQSSFGLGFSQPVAPVKPLLAQWSTDEVDRVAGSPLQAGMRKVGWPLLSQAGKTDTRASASNSKDLAALPELPAKSEQAKQELSLWIAGTVDFGQRNANGQQEGFRFTTNGVSMGADYRLSDQLTIGVGTGYSRDRSDIGDSGSKSIGQSMVAAVYGSVRPTPEIFIDGMLGYGALNFDSTRYITGDGSFATGQRHGQQVFVALAGGYEFRGESWMWSPYGKLDLASTTLGQYTEAAAGNNALTYFKQQVRTTSGTFGLRTEGQYLSRAGMWTPRARVEYRRQFSGAGEAGISYADLASSGPAYVIRSDDSFTGNWTAGLGMRLLMSDGMSLIVDYSSNLNVGQGRYSSILFGVNVPLR